MKSGYDTAMRVAFLDRDGTLVYEPPETKHITPDDVRILPGVIDGLRRLKDAGYKLIVVSNQSAGSTYDIRDRDFAASQKIFGQKLEEHGIRFDHVFVCLHMPEDGCACRKPKTGMVDDFLAQHEIDREHSLMIGDRETDGEFANNIGVRFLKMESNARFPMNPRNS
jgi:imidazoleglycerol-phosphate dehydratase/histidinol-phosphatase